MNHEMTMKTIQVQGLTKRYDDIVAVDDISFSVREGEIFAFLGANGSGKSTTIKMLTTLLSPTGGSIHLNGYDPVTRPDHTRRSFDMVVQESNLDDDLTAYENMQLHGVLYHIPGSDLHESIERVMWQLDLWERRNDRVRSFSAEMKRRLEIARGVLHRPRILFLDEPTLGLGARARNGLWEYIREMNRQEDMTVFFTTQYIDEAEQMAERIAIIDHGRIVALGSAAELKRQTQADSLEGAFLALTGGTRHTLGINHIRTLGLPYRQ